MRERNLSRRMRSSSNHSNNQFINSRNKAYSTKDVPFISSQRTQSIQRQEEDFATEVPLEFRRELFPSDPQWLAQEQQSHRSGNPGYAQRFEDAHGREHHRATIDIGNNESMVVQFRSGITLSSGPNSEISIGALEIPSAYDAHFMQFFQAIQYAVTHTGLVRYLASGQGGNVQLDSRLPDEFYDSNPGGPLGGAYSQNPSRREVQIYDRPSIEIESRSLLDRYPEIHHINALNYFTTYIVLTPRGTRSFRNRRYVYRYTWSQSQYYSRSVNRRDDSGNSYSPPLVRVISHEQLDESFRLPAEFQHARVDYRRQQ